MADLNIILTADYEVFGNGSGEVPTCMINPSDQLISIANEHRIPVTFFVDVCELWAFEEVESNGRWDMGYSPSGLIKNQLIEALKSGHDVQLHFHPQWLDYEYLGEGKWKLNHDLWRLPELNTEELNKLFRKGKKYLEDLFKPIKKNYKCHVFRAGGWCIQPESDILKAMKKHGFNVESSVAPGAFNDEIGFEFDFRKAPDKPFWNIDVAVDQEGADGIVEIPIFTHRVPISKRIWFLKERFSNKVPVKPVNCKGYSENSNRRSKLSKARDLISSKVSMFNFTDATTASEMKYMAMMALERNAKDDRNIPIVMIGHPKTFANEKELKEFLFWCSNKEEISFTTYFNYLNENQSFS